jgi:hypothetical protein
MNVFLANLVVIAVLGLLVLRRGRDRRVENVRAAHLLRIAALIPLGLQGAVFLLFGVAEMAGGDLSGAGHLVQLAVPVLLAILAWMRPLEGGIGMLVGGAVSAVPFVAALVAARPAAEPTVMSPALVILAVPLMISGALFFIAGLLARRATTIPPNPPRHFGRDWRPS